VAKIGGMAEAVHITGSEMGQATIHVQYSDSTL
jgi:hypothetical protein